MEVFDSLFLNLSLHVVTYPERFQTFFVTYNKFYTVQHVWGD